MINVVVTGCTGRMGQIISKLVIENDNTNLVGAIEIEGHELIGTDIGTFLGYDKLGVKISSDFLEEVQKADVYIDFTSPEASLKFLTLAASKNRSAVIGTTGFSASDLEFIHGKAETIPVVLAPNMSLGVNLLFYLTKKITEVLKGKGYDIEMVERHHRHKLDAPSGTAVRLGEIVAEVLGKELDDIIKWGRYGRVKTERSDDEVGIMSLRGGEVVGEHTLYFSGKAEELIITHRAFSREAFARGAVDAAIWVSDKNSGFYDMQDILGLKEEAK